MITFEFVDENLYDVLIDGQFVGRTKTDSPDGIKTLAREIADEADRSEIRVTEKKALVNYLRAKAQSKRLEAVNMQTRIVTLRGRVDALEAYVGGPQTHVIPEEAEPSCEAELEP